MKGLMPNAVIVRKLYLKRVYDPIQGTSTNAKKKYPDFSGNSILLVILLLFGEGMRLIFGKHKPLKSDRVICRLRGVDRQKVDFQRAGSDAGKQTLRMSNLPAKELFLPSGKGLSSGPRARSYVNRS